MPDTSTGIGRSSIERRHEARSARSIVAVASVCAVLLAACTKETPETLIKAAQRHIAGHDYRSALIELRNAVALAPGNGTAYRLLGSTFLVGGDPRAAEGALRQALSLAQRPDDVLPALAQSMLRQGQAERLIAELGTRRLQDPAADASLQTSLGQAWLTQGDTRKAGDAFATALTQTPGAPLARLGQAMIAAQGGDIGKAASIADEILARDPRLTEGHAFKAQLLLSQGRRKEAAESLEQAVAVDAGNLSARLALASLRIDERAYDKAQTLLEASRAPWANDPRLTFLRSLLALRMGDLRRAKNEVATILARAPDHVPTLTLDAEIELRSGYPDLAETDLQKALYVDPSAVTARKLLAATYLRQGRPAKAINVLQPLLQQAGVGDPALMALAGEAYLASGDSARASEFFERSASDPGSGANARLRLGQIALTRGDFDRGASELQAASAMDTEHEQADLLLFAFHLRRREIDKALAAAGAFVKKQPRNPLGYVLEGTAHLAGKDRIGARKSFDAALAIQPDYLPALRGLADVDVAESQSATALRRYEALLATKPKDEQLLVAFAGLQERMGKVAEAGATLRRAVEANPRSPTPYFVLVQYDLRQRQAQAALTVAQAGVAANPAQPRFVELLGNTQEATGAQDAALKSFEELASLEPQSLTPLMKLAALQTRRRDFDSAAQSLRQAQRASPDSDEIARDLVAAYLSVRRFDDALAVATALRTRKPASASGFALEGDVQAAWQKWPEAERAYRAGLAAEPRSGVAAVGLCRMLSASGRKNESAAFATAWIARNPADIPMRMYVADVALSANDYPAAASQYVAVLQQAPDEVPALNNLAWTLGEMKDPRALGFAERAVALAPNSPIALDTLGMLQLEQGDAKKALESLARMRDLAPDRKDLRLHYAMGLLRAGRIDEGKAELRELVASKDDFSGKATIPALLK
jgi:putative PEP-CTERM system TPR-repeat lipoprotein